MGNENIFNFKESECVSFLCLNCGTQQWTHLNTKGKSDVDCNNCGCSLMIRKYRNRILVEVISPDDTNKEALPILEALDLYYRIDKAVKAKCDVEIRTNANGTTKLYTIKRRSEGDLASNM